MHRQQRLTIEFEKGFSASSLLCEFDTNSIVFFSYHFLIIANFRFRFVRHADGQPIQIMHSVDEAFQSCTFIQTYWMLVKCTQHVQYTAENPF